MLSLESVLGFCHGIAKGGDCKVEFIQPSNWLYSVPNLLVIQHLVTLYLGGFDVRVVSEIEWSLLKSVQENRVSRLGLAGDSRLQAARSNVTCQACWKVNSLLAGALQDKTGQLAIRLSRDWISRLSQAARSSREPPLFCKTWRFTFLSHSSINTPITHDWKRASRENFERETLKKNKIDSPTIYTLESLQIPQLSSSPLSNPWEALYQTWFSPSSSLWDSCLDFWEAVRKEPIFIGWCYGLVAESGKLEKKKVRRNLVGARSLEGLGALGRLGLEGLLLSLYPNYIF